MKPQINYIKNATINESKQHTESHTNGGIFFKMQIIIKDQTIEAKRKDKEKSHTCRKMGIILMQSIEVVTNLKQQKKQK